MLYSAHAGVWGEWIHIANPRKGASLQIVQVLGVMFPFLQLDNEECLNSYIGKVALRGNGQSQNHVQDMFCDHWRSFHLRETRPHTPPLITIQIITTSQTSKRPCPTNRARSPSVAPRPHAMSHPCTLQRRTWDLDSPSSARDSTPGPSHRPPDTTDPSSISSIVHSTRAHCTPHSARSEAMSACPAYRSPSPKS